MSNAMKKLKLLHHLTAASASHPSTHAPVPACAQPSAQQQVPTPPASPVSPQTSPIRHQYHPTHSHAHYTDVLRSARAALQTLHTSQPSYTNTTYPPPPPPASMQRPQQQQPATQCLLPGGFMVLTPTPSYDNMPGLCVPASPPPTGMAINHHHFHLSSPVTQNSVPRGNTTIYSQRPPAVGASPKTATTHQARPRSPPKSRQRLTREAVAKVGKDSRLARWERVLGYVREQRAATLPASSSATTTSPPPKTLDRKRRAEEIAAIEARNHLLDSIDLEEQDRRSLWSGGSGGTNGVDEFVWSEDEDDDVKPMPSGPPPIKVLPDGYVGSSSSRDNHNDEGIFECEMQMDEDLPTPPTRLSTSTTLQDRKRSRPKSTPEELSLQRLWGKRIVEEMPALCREGELEGGLGRLMGRRMSTAY